MAAALLLLLVAPAGLLAALAFLARPRGARVPLKGRHVFITGGSSGIGLAMATAAAREGARVSILARNLARLEEARAAIQRDSGRDDVGVHAADVRDAGAVELALRDAGPVDVLVCNHGVFVPQELERQDMEEIKWMVDINLMGTFHLIKAALPAMKARTRETRLPGSIAIMSSQAGQVGIYGYTAYSASKFALRGLGEALQHEVITDNIHVSLIFPPDTETPGLEEEHKRRPELTNIIAGSSGGMKANDVAKKALNGIKSAKFIVPCNFEGAMLAVATAGLSPQSSPVMAFLEVIGAGLMRFAALCFQWNWFSKENLKSSFLYKFIHLHSYKKQIAAGVVYILLHLLHWKQSGVSQISTAPAVVNSAQYKHPSRLSTRDAKWTPGLPNPPGASDNRALPPFPASELAGVSRSGSSSGEPPGFRWPLLHYLPQNERRADDGIGIQKREHASNKNERF